MQRLSLLWLSIAVQDDGSCLICHCSLLKAFIAVTFITDVQVLFPGLRNVLSKTLL